MPEHLVAVMQGSNWAQGWCERCGWHGPLYLDQQAATHAGVDASRHAAEMSEPAPASAGGAEGGR